MNRIELTRVDALMNLGAFLNTHFTMVGLIGKWLHNDRTRDIVFGNVQVCRLHHGDSFGIFDTICSTDIISVEDWIQPVQYLLVVGFICSLHTFVITNWALANSCAEKILPLMALCSFLGSFLGSIFWINGKPVNLPESDKQFYYNGYGIYFTISASFMSFIVLLLSSYRLK